MPKSDLPRKLKASFVEPILLQRRAELPDGKQWLIELKLDGFRAIAFKTGVKVHLRSRNNKDFNSRYPSVVTGLSGMPDDTVLDGEIVALDESGRPSFNVLQNYGSSQAPILYYLFEVMMLAGRDLTTKTLDERRDLLEAKVLPKLEEPIRQSPELKGKLADLVRSVKAQGFEGLIAKRRNSEYQPRQRSRAWQKMRVNQGQEFVIGGYTVGGATFDALIFGYYEGSRLLYAGRTRSGFTPKVRAELSGVFRPLEIPNCPFANLPEQRSGRWGAGLAAAKMANCRWLKPVLIGQFEFAEWTPDKSSSALSFRRAARRQEPRGRLPGVIFVAKTDVRHSPFVRHKLYTVWRWANGNRHGRRRRWPAIQARRLGIERIRCGAPVSAYRQGESCLRAAHPTRETIFEIACEGKIHRVSGVNLREWIQRRRGELGGPAGYLFSKRAVME